jgi:hypothetical protein
MRALPVCMVLALPATLAAQTPDATRRAERGESDSAGGVAQKGTRCGPWP